MGHINLYKLDSEKIQAFTQDLLKKMNQENTVERTVRIPGKDPETFGLTLYLARPEYRKDIGWNWVLEEFDSPEIQVTPSPKAVILIERDDGSEYAVTYGHSFFTVDKYCDRDFGFNFARRLRYKEIKTTTLTTPSSRRNKTVNTYINYSELDFDSGESFAKLKAKVDLADGFPLYKPAIEIGSSIKFATLEESLEQILELIIHVEDTIQNCEEICKIPVFSRIKDEATIQYLNERLRTSIQENPAQINISELDIIGATEVFNSNDGEFVLRYKRKTKQVTSLSNEELEGFCSENGWSYGSVMLDIAVVSLYDGDSVATDYVKDLIDYTDDEERALLSKGIWYKFNDDYLTYLADSIAEIDVEYHPEFDFTTQIHDTFVDERFDAERGDPKYAGKTTASIKKSLKRKYYAERAFNLIRESQDEFQNFDRTTDGVGGAKVEAMDLYKDEMMLTVKIGNTSGKLCYAVDQSLTSLKLYKKGELPGMPKVTTVVLWLILERERHIEGPDDIPDLNQLNMLMLKNRLDQWKKEVRLAGMKPLVYINYRTD